MVSMYQYDMFKIFLYDGIMLKFVFCFWEDRNPAFTAAKMLILRRGVSKISTLGYKAACYSLFNKTFMQ